MGASSSTSERFTSGAAAFGTLPDAQIEIMSTPRGVILVPSRTPACGGLLALRNVTKRINIEVSAHLRLAGCLTSRTMDDSIENADRKECRMVRRYFAPALSCASAFAAIIFLIPLGTVRGQGTAKSKVKAYTPPKTPWGDPDLQGIWPATDLINVPVQRPESFG